MANAARTRDLLNHNQMLYQLSYSHHVLTSMRKRNEWILYTIFGCARVGVLRFGRQVMFIM